MRMKLAAGSVLVLVSACGGGGSGGSSTAMMTLQAAPAPAQPIMVPLTTLSATVNGTTYTIQYSVTPNQGTVSFNGQMASSSTLNLQVLNGMALVLNDTTTEYYVENPYMPLGISGTTETGTGFTFTITTESPLPSTLMVGDSGTLFSGNYTGADGSAIGMLTETYSVTADTASTLTLTIEDDGTINGNEVIISPAFTVNDMGKIVALQQVTVTVNGQTYTFTGSM
jgi:hypothetical protein